MEMTPHKSIFFAEATFGQSNSHAHISINVDNLPSDFYVHYPTGEDDLGDVYATVFETYEEARSWLLGMGFNPAEIDDCTVPQTNEEWVDFMRVVLDLSLKDIDTLIHDINNLHGDEWIEDLKKSAVGPAYIDAYKERFNIAEEKEII